MLNACWPIRVRGTDGSHHLAAGSMRVVLVEAQAAKGRDRVEQGPKEPGGETVQVLLLALAFVTVFRINRSESSTTLLTASNARSVIRPNAT